MLIHPWDAASSDTEWHNWLAGHDFGQLAVSDPGNGAPHVIPTHFAVDDYAYIPITWRAKVGGPDEDGVPTSYYSAVQLTCHAEIVDDPRDKAGLLRRQFAHFQPQGDHAQVAADMPPTAGCSQESAACACTSPASPPSSKYDDHNPQEHRTQVAGRLENRGTGRDRTMTAWPPSPPNISRTRWTRSGSSGNCLAESARTSLLPTGKP